MPLSAFMKDVNFNPLRLASLGIDSEANLRTDFKAKPDDEKIIC